MYDIIMYVYSDIKYDPRANRTLKALNAYTNSLVISVGDERSNTWYENIPIPKKKSGALGYFLNFLAFTRAVRGKKCTFFCANNFYSALPALYMKLFKKCKYVIYDAYELYTKEETKTVSALGLFIRLESFITKKADIVICAQTNRAEKMKEMYNLYELPLVIRNYSYLETSEAPLRTEVENFFKSPRLTVVYAGFLSEDRQVMRLVDALKIQKEKFKLLVISADERIEKVRKKAEEYGIDYLCVGGMPHIELGNVLKRCDIGYLAYANDILNNRFCSPNKIYEYMSVGLAVLSNENETLSKLVDKFGIGIASEDYVDGLERIADNIVSYKKKSQSYDIQSMMYEELNELSEAVKGLNKIK